MTKHQQRKKYWEKKIRADWKAMGLMFQPNRMERRALAKGKIP